jgi:hypothetical protein
MTRLVVGAFLCSLSNYRLAKSIENQALSKNGGYIFLFNCFKKVFEVKHWLLAEEPIVLLLVLLMPLIICCLY